MENKLQDREAVRIPNFDNSTTGAYFITICTANREKIFWSDHRGELYSPAGNAYSGDRRLRLQVEFSTAGKIVDNEIQKLNAVYKTVHVDKYCILPDHIHLILSVDSDENGQMQVAPVITKVIKQFKGSVSKQVGNSVWQKSFFERAICNQEDYSEIWEYIENNWLKYLLENAL